MSATDALTITSALDALTRYYDAKEREESAVLYINDAYLEALNSLEKLEAENFKLRELCERCAIELYVNGNVEDAATENLFDDMRELGIEVS